MNIRVLLKKSTRVLKEEGIGVLARKTSLYLKNVANGQKMHMDSERAKHVYSDVLFINGCYLAHPTRYRISHQREQLRAGNISTAEVFYKDLSLDMVKNCRLFIFFRCPYTDLIGEFVEKAKAYNKTVLFDIDDLMIDTFYTDSIFYVQTMTASERRLYDDGVIAAGKLLALCDGAITTTEALAEELRKYVSDVHINRNVASEEMIRLSKKAWEQKEKTEKTTTKIGYFSGSITHNPDFVLVLPALLRLMKDYQHVELILVGELTIPEELKPYASRVIVSSMKDWRRLPELIASVDINIAPLEDTLFNQAKSENKWIEAALVKVPTIASRVGAFAAMIEDGTTGILCENSETYWYGKLAYLVNDKDARTVIAENAYHYVYENCTSVYTSANYADYIYYKMHTNIAFMLPVTQISGGALVTLKHASILQRLGFDVTVFNDGYEPDIELEYDRRKLPVIPKRTTQIDGNIDKCVATLWSTCEFFEKYGKIKERFYLVQNFETDFYEPGENLRIRANQTYQMHMPVKYITISRWCESWLEDKYKIQAQYAPNGLDVERFYSVERDYSGKIRVLVEGNSDDYYKNVDESFRITNQLDLEKFEIWYMSYQGKPKDWYRVDKFLHKVPYSQVPTVYRDCHILIKSSILESFSYPPLEMMATGGCVVVAPNGGNVEYLRDRENCLFYQPGNTEDAYSKIMEIIENEALRKILVDGGIKTGQTRAWDKIEADILALYQ